MKAKKLKVAYLFQNNGIRFSKSFAVQLHIYHLIRGLQQAGHCARLLALQSRQVLFTDKLEDVRQDNLSAEHFAQLGAPGSKPYKLAESGIRRLQSTLQLPYFALFDSHRMYDACRKNLAHYDIIHERHNTLSLGGAVASQKMQIPYILEVNADMIEESAYQGTPERGVRGRYSIWSMEYCLKTAKRIISVSADLKDHFVQKWQIDPDKIIVLPNAADTEVFGRSYDTFPVREQLGLKDEQLIMFVGGFYVWHDLTLLIDSFATLRQHNPNARLVLVGDGRTRPDIEHKIEEHNLDHSVIMTGPVEHEKVPQLLAAADVAVAPNIAFFKGHGGSPLKIFEYMAAGKAIVATATGQVKDVIRDGVDGLLVPPGDTVGFANSLGSLLNDAAKRQQMGQAARQRAMEKYSWEHYTHQLECIYESALRES